jgi:hypothetical protein
MERMDMEGWKNEISKYASNLPFPAKTDCVPCLNYAEKDSKVPNADHFGIQETTPPVIAK